MVSKSVFNFVVIFNLLATTFINPQTLSPFQLLPLSFMILSFSVVMALHSLTSNCLAATISTSFFLPNIYEALLILFPIFGLFICFRHISLSFSPSLLLDCKFLLKRLPVTVDPCIFVASSYSSAFPIEHTCNYLPVRSMTS